MEHLALYQNDDQVIFITLKVISSVNILSTNIYFFLSCSFNFFIYTADYFYFPILFNYY